VDWAQAGLRRIAPVVFAAELAMLLMRRIRRGALRTDTAGRLLDAAFAAVTLTPEDAELAGRALEIAHALGHRNAHGGLEIALAERHRCALWTAEREFTTSARRLFPHVQWAGER
jgi:predicted nucleic acid-binding protein